MKTTVGICLAWLQGLEHRLGSISVRITLILLILQITGHKAFTQLSYSLEGLEVSSNVGSYYDRQIGLTNTPITLGVYYQPQFTRGEGHPNFMNKFWSEASMSYRGEVFDSLNILYDLVNDKVVVQHPNIKYSSQGIMVNQDQIDWFEIAASRFVNFHDLERPGIYQVIFSGKNFDLLIKRRKISSIDKDNQASFRDDDHYYFVQGAHQQKVKRISWFWRNDKQNRQTLKSYVKAQKLNSSLRKCSIDQLHAFSLYYEGIILEGGGDE
ncbi:hypothetical protein [Marinoscillum sp. MHG1-6]|uniref:hypothetical protein n=1 Tax=Marinoscillum sp. MHG1-6 TaxID=2959627 RepID=UPI002157086D|nr:hypothetical protein [Marinoscillum sp. MHG1-6]